MTSSKDGVFEKHADKIAQMLQRMAEDDAIFEFRQSITSSPSKQNARELKNSKRSLKILGNFEKLFRRKLHDPSSGIIVSNCLKFLCFTYQRVNKNSIEIMKILEFDTLIFQIIYNILVLYICI